MIKILLGIDICGFNQGAIFDTTNFLGSYYNTQLQNATVDDIYITNDLTVTNTITKPNTWKSLDVLNCDFQGNLEGGSISGSGQYITSVAVQKRDTSVLTWDTVTIIPYAQGQTTLFDYKDYYVGNGENLEYTLVPFVNDIQGITAPTSSTIKVAFDSMFLTDATYNYQLAFDPKLGDLSYQTYNSVFEPIGAQYPITQYQTLNYRKQTVSTTLFSPIDYQNLVIDIGNEKAYRDSIASFLLNRRPKLLRTLTGDLLIINIVGQPKISFPTNRGITNVSFDFVEINSVSYANLVKYGLNR